MQPPTTHARLVAAATLAAAAGCAADAGTPFDGTSVLAAGCLAALEDDEQARSDADQDGLSLRDECLRYASDPEDRDTDGDGLDDGVEVALYRSSPATPDTDGDGWTDLDEVRQGTSPIVANVPVVEVVIATSPTVSLNAVYSEEGAELLSEETTSLRTASTAVSETDARATSTSITNSQEITTSVSASYPWGASASVEGRVSFEQGYTQEHTTSWTQDSVSSSENAAARARETQRSTSRSYADGTIRVGFDVENLGDRDVVVRNLTVAALHRDILSVAERPALVAELRPSVAEDGVDEGVQVNAGATKGPLESVNATVEADLVERVLAFPAGLFFQVSGFDMDELDDDGRVARRFTASALKTQTAVIVIDYGDGRVDRHLVSTALDRAIGGIRMADALVSAGLDTPEGDAPRYATEPRPSDGVRVLTRVRNVATREYGASPLGNRCTHGGGFWFVTTSSQSLDGGSIDFEDLVLEGGDVAQLTYLTDCDGDTLPDRNEIVLGSNPLVQDTDGDGLDDAQEVSGWLSFDVLRTSDPRFADTDQDGVPDLEEGTRGSDPRDPCDPAPERCE